MKILLVSAKFPPYTSNGSVRASKQARYFAAYGHEVRVLTAGDLPLMTGLKMEIDPQWVTSTPWFSVNFLPELLFGGKKQVAQKGYKGGAAGLKGWSKLYRTFFHFPDDLIGWVPYAVKAGKQIIAGWQPDLIYASGMPFSALMAASRLHTATRIPWVAEFRDLWGDHAYYEFPEWRRRLENWLEGRTVKDAAAIVTVSPPWTDWMGRKYHKPVETVLNGFDPADFPIRSGDPNTPLGKLVITYTGAVYLPYQDPSPLFAALQQMGEQAESIQVNFYSRYFDPILTLADKYSVGHLVHGHGLVPYQESLRQQVEADINLMLDWNDIKGLGVIPAKMYEYFGCRRPILAIGIGKGAAANMIRSRGAGVVLDDPDQIAKWLQTILEQKKSSGEIAPVPLEAQKGLSRDEQFEVLERFLIQLLQ